MKRELIQFTIDFENAFAQYSVHMRKAWMEAADGVIKQANEYGWNGLTERQRALFNKAREDGVLDIIEHALGTELPLPTSEKPYVQDFHKDDGVLAGGRYLQLTHGIYIPREEPDTDDAELKFVFFRGYRVNKQLSFGEKMFSLTYTKSGLVKLEPESHLVGGLSHRVSLEELGKEFTRVFIQEHLSNESRQRVAFLPIGIMHLAKY
jgi:hypothetical protein